MDYTETCKCLNELVYCKYKLEGVQHVSSLVVHGNYTSPMLLPLNNNIGFLPLSLMCSMLDSI